MLILKILLKQAVKVNAYILIMETCELCGCNTDDISDHHLIPRLKCKNKYKELKNDKGNILKICRSCHDQIHALFSESELRDLYNTKEKILESAEMQKFINWKKKHPDFKGHAKMGNRRR